MCSSSWGLAAFPFIAPASLVGMIWHCLPKFRGYSQQDAHEAMLSLLDYIDHEWLVAREYVAQSRARANLQKPHPHPIPREPPANPSAGSLVAQFFRGALTSYVQCTQCHHLSVTTEPFSDLSLSSSHCPRRQYRP